MAVLEKRAGLALSNQDIYINVVGGLKIDDPSADLPVILAAASTAATFLSRRGRSRWGRWVWRGEVRAVPGIKRPYRRGGPPRLPEDRHPYQKQAGHPSGRRRDLPG